MAFIAAAWITKGAMHHFLEHEMPARMLPEVRDFEQKSKVLDAAVHVAADEHFRVVRKLHESAGATGRGSKRVDGLAQGDEQFFRIGHGILDESTVRRR